MEHFQVPDDLEEQRDWFITSSMLY